MSVETVISAGWNAGEPAFGAPAAGNSGGLSAVRHCCYRGRRRRYKRFEVIRAHSLSSHK
jgi:hypothetical protein